MQHLIKYMFKYLINILHIFVNTNIGVRYENKIVDNNDFRIFVNRGRSFLL